MTEVERVEREQRLAEIRERLATTLRLTLGEFYCDDAGGLCGGIKYLLGEIDSLLTDVERLQAERDALNDLPVGTDIRHLPSGRWSVEIPDCCVYEARDTLAEAVTAATGASTVSSASPCRAQLEQNVVEAALAWRWALSNYWDTTRRAIFHSERSTAEESAMDAFGGAWERLKAAVDALLAFLGEDEQ